MRPASFALCLLCSVLVVAQIPSSWRVCVLSSSERSLTSALKDPKMTTSIIDRINIAKGAIDEALAQLDSTSGQFADPNNTYPAAGSLFAQMAKFDLVTNQTVYQDTLLNLWPVAQATSISLGNINFTGDLSAWLAETVSDPIYLEAARQSLAFLQAHLYSTSQNLVLDTIGAKAGSSCTAASTLYPKNTGLLLEGLAVLNSITENSTTIEWATQILSAVFSTTAWQGVDGILRPANSVISNGLQVAYTNHLGSNSSIIAAYLAVQFNAITTLARTNNSNIYGTLGNPASTFNLNDQIQAIGSLIAAINIETNSSITNTPSSTMPDSATATDSSNHVENRWHTIAIAVSVSGAMTLLGAILALVLIFRWQHRKHQQRLSLHTPKPFTEAEISMSMQVLSPKARLKSMLLSEAQQGQVSSSSDTRFKPELRRILEATSEATMPVSSAPQPEVMATVLQPELQVEILPSGSQNTARDSQVLAGMTTSHHQPHIMADELLQLLLERINQSQNISLGIDSEEPPQYTG
uniref:Glycoside hydrolase family 76 protein n=1 Tax=Mycena chlorophos TaxID=658473 RepID=A0ABQ0LEX8_MYCCL|nr:glycoside hydrolase family 76 protein [Mycena chlorophos]